MEESALKHRLRASFSALVLEARVSPRPLHDWHRSSLAVVSAHACSEPMVHRAWSTRIRSILSRWFAVPSAYSVVSLLGMKARGIGHTYKLTSQRVRTRAPDDRTVLLLCSVASGG
jgi:hypothetical protein